mgnify:CR=1 FL=1
MRVVNIRKTFHNENESVVSILLIIGIALNWYGALAKTSYYVITFAPFDDQIPIGCLILWKSRHEHLFAKAIHYHNSRELTLKQQSK